MDVDVRQPAAALAGQQRAIRALLSHLPVPYTLNPELSFKLERIEEEGEEDSLKDKR